MAWESEEHVLQQDWAPVLLGVHPRGILPLCPWRQAQGCSMSSVTAEDRKLPNMHHACTEGHVWSRQWPWPHGGAVCCREGRDYFTAGHCVASGVRPLFGCDHSCPRPLASIRVIPQPVPRFIGLFFTAKLKTLYREHPDTPSSFHNYHAHYTCLAGSPPCVCLSSFRSGVFQGKLHMLSLPLTH